MGNLSSRYSARSATHLGGSGGSAGGGGVSSSTGNTGPSTGSLVWELSPDLAYDKSLGSNQFLKTIRCRHGREGLVVVKIFLKEPGTHFHQEVQRLHSEMQALESIPNCLTYSTLMETSFAVYAIRQHMSCNLYDRLSTRPFLRAEEKIWITFQLLLALSDIHNKNIVHGDLTMKNILITSFNFIQITDFSSFKPALLAEDDPADFSFYFDSSSRRACYVAPERFFNNHAAYVTGSVSSSYIHSKNVLGSSSSTSASSNLSRKWEASTVIDGNFSSENSALLSPSMDIFSCGCVIAELFLDGSALFSLSQLLSFRKGEYDSNIALKRIENTFIRELISSMTSLDPINRKCASEYLSQFRDIVFPMYLSKSLHPFCVKYSAIQTNVDFLEPWLNSSDRKLKMIQSAISGPLVYLAHETIGKLVCTSLITSCLNHASQLEYKYSGIETLAGLAESFGPLDDDLKLDRILPYLVQCLTDEQSSIRHIALLKVQKILNSIENITSGEACIVADYLLPAVHHFTSDPEPFIRSAYVSCLSDLASVGSWMLEIKMDDDEYDDCKDVLLRLIQHDVSILLTDKSSAVKHALLVNMPSFALFFGRQVTHDILLSHMITFLNDPDWNLRRTFFTTCVGMGPILHPRSVEEYILPLLISSLYDPNEAVVEVVLSTITQFAGLGFFAKRDLIDLMDNIFPLLVHPSLWVRLGAMSYVSVLANLLSYIDQRCIMYQKLVLFLKFELPELSLCLLVNALIAPVPRRIYIEAIAGQPIINSSPLHSLTSLPLLQEYINKTRCKKVPKCDLPSMDPIVPETVFMKDKNFSPSSPLRKPDEVPSDAVASASLFPSHRKTLSTAAVMEYQTTRKRPVSLELPSNHDAPCKTLFATFLQDKLKKSFFFDIPFTYRYPCFDISSPVNDTSGQQWTPDGSLVAVFTEHTCPVRQLAIASDHSCFLTVGQDVRIWDSRKLTRNVSHRSRLVYSEHGKALVTDAIFIPFSYSVASCSEDSQIHLYSINVSDSGKSRSYLGFTIQARMTLPAQEYALKLGFYAPNSYSHLLVFCTNRGHVIACRVPSMIKEFSITIPSHYGMITASSIAEHTMVVGTSNGVFVVIDLRFRVIVRNWAHPLRTRFHDIHHIPGNSRLFAVSVAGKTNEVSVWDCLNKKCLKVFASFSSPVASADDDTVAQAEMEEVYGRGLFPMDVPHSWNMGSVDGDLQSLSECSVRSFALHSASSFLLTGGSDANLRFWNLESLSKSRKIDVNALDSLMNSVSYSSTEYRGSVFHIEWTAAKSGNSIPHRQSLGPLYGHGSRSHVSMKMDCITQVGYLLVPFPMILFTGRDGSLRIMK